MKDAETLQSADSPSTPDVSTTTAEPAQRSTGITVWMIPAAVVILDQLTKWAIAATMDLHQSVAVLGDWFRFTYIMNPGGAFGVRWGHQGFYFIAAILVIAWIVWHLYRHHTSWHLSTGALSLILGGAVGNLIDRVIRGEVIDFIDVEFPDMTIPAFDFGFVHHAGTYMDRWPTFNIADSAVTVGVIVLIVTLFYDPIIGRRQDTTKATD